MRLLCSLTILLLLLGASVSPTGGQDPATETARTEFFEARIRPVLVEHCYACHNSVKKARGGLALDHRVATREESNSGTAVVPGRPEASLLMKVLRHELEDLEMPKDGPRLADEVVADFERWIREGAHDPRDTPPTPAELNDLTSWEGTLARRKEWWSLQPIQSPKPPVSRAGSDHAVDRFVERQLERNGLERAAPADRRTLMRRLSYAVTGLPPTLEQLGEYLADEEPGATERLIERLLASPHYGERWARHWMDLVRYADSHGSEGDPAIPEIHRYRDYLIRAFNADVPYDQLVREHVAGDLLAEPRVNEELGIVESAIGTAHWRLVFHGFAPTDALDEKVRFVDDQINVFGKTFLAQTISCARCHDHKFDAISQADYYALFGILGSCRPAMQDVNTPGRQRRDRERLGELKAQVRAGLAEAWLAELDEITERLADPSTEDLERAKEPGHPLRPLVELDRRMGEGLTFEEAWNRVLAQATGDDDESGPDAWRADLSDAAEHARWFPFGNGLGEVPAPAGSIAIEPEGERILTGIYPAGVYTHLLSTRHRGVLHSARRLLDGEYDVWFRVVGGGNATLRYVVQNYPRSGTVYPIQEIKGPDWYWHRLDLSYWEGDDVHLELATGRDGPLEVRGAERSWFGLREVLLRRKGTKGPNSRPDEISARALQPVGSDAPRTPEELTQRLAGELEGAIVAWQNGAASDHQALLLDGFLRAGLLANALAELPQVAGVIAAYRELEQEVPLPTRVPGMAETEAFDQPLLVRGDHRRPGEPVPRRFLEAIDDTPYRTLQSGRLELAEDLLRADNPLTARVIVNRIWHHLFGRGIVATPDNFGRLGKLPTHPELLDHLATRMVEGGWSIKGMIRYLLTSRTWQQSSLASPAALAADPENLWLSHASQRRLDAESIRDSLFAVAGRLDEQMYGPGFGANRATPRRSVYVQSRRNSLDAFLEAFDSPVPFATVGRRSTTNVPAQSLALLNSPLVAGAAAGWGGAVRSNRRFTSDDDRLAHMFESLTCRAPTRTELEALRAFVDTTVEGIRHESKRRVALEERIGALQTSIEGILSPPRAQLLAETKAGAAERPAGPVPLARWDFTRGLQDTIGDLDGVLHGSARLEQGSLRLDGGGHVATPPIPVELRAKTLEAWVRLEDLDQRGGGLITVQDLQGSVFDSIVFGERIPGRWMAGSNNFQRSEDFGGSDERLAIDETVHLALAYDEDGTIRGYRNGVSYGAPYRKADLAPHAAGKSQVLFGLRHGNPDGGRLLRGRIIEARLHARALSSEEIAASAAGGAFVSRAAVLEALGEAGRSELALLEEELERDRAELAGLGQRVSEGAAWSRVAQALFNLKEFLYLR
ncbi:MAG: DUF1553 domain-containing protein [Planctomycetota bacterium]|nr:DUF1553 domain-containing protein [Planctomycetota bacterium]